MTMMINYHGKVQVRSLVKDYKVYSLCGSFNNWLGLYARLPIDTGSFSLYIQKRILNFCFDTWSFLLPFVNKNNVSKTVYLSRLWVYRTVPCEI